MSMEESSIISTCPPNIRSNKTLGSSGNGGYCSTVSGALIPTGAGIELDIPKVASSVVGITLIGGVTFEILGIIGFSESFGE